MGPSAQHAGSPDVLWPALQTVIALARKRQYVPFRSCKLTHFLKDSIGGNCKTLLIACVWSDVSPSFFTHKPPLRCRKPTHADYLKSINRSKYVPPFPASACFMLCLRECVTAWQRRQHARQHASALGRVAETPLGR